MTPRTIMGLRLPVLRWQDWFFIGAAVNFLAYGFISVSIGGDALNGHSAAGRYFLSDHGRLTQVGPATFLFSQVYTSVTVAFLGLAALFRGLVKKRLEDAEKALARRVRSRYRWQS